MGSVTSSRAWSRTFLAWTCALVLAAAALFAAIAAGLRTSGTDRPRIPEPLVVPGAGDREEPPDPRTWLDPWLASEDTDFGDVLDAIGWLATAPNAGGPDVIEASIARSIEEPVHAELATLLVRSWRGDEDAMNRLMELAVREPPPRYANLALGHALPPSETRAAAYELEARLYDSDRARRHALETYAVLDREEDIERLRRDPRYERVWNARIPYTLAYIHLDWVGLLLWTGPAQHARVSWTFIALGIATAIIWLFFLAYAGDIRTIKSSRFALCLIAVVLGALSTVPTLVLDVWMQEVLGVERSESLLGGLAFFVASVGLREEACKLLCFLPLVPFVIRSRDPLLMLIVAGCTGLGFAAEENVSYFSESGGGDAAGRFLTANFGHVVDTGLIGFAFCRMCLEPKRATEFLLVFVLVVIGHGVYDALILLPDLETFRPLSGTIYVAVAYVYFGELRDFASREKRRFPLTAVFVYGLTTLLALTLIAASWELGFGAALGVMIPGTLGAALFVFVFFRQIDEPLLP